TNMKLWALIIILIFICERYTIKSEVPSGITQILLQLNAKYKTNLNLFINTQDVNLDYQLLEIPAIQLQMEIKNFHQFRLLGSFSNNALIIVNIKVPPLDPDVANYLPYLLRELHELHIVFITVEDPISWQEDLYRYCYEEGFINILLIHENNQTQLLYSYKPYPEIKSIQLPQLEDYFNRRLRIWNFHHYPVRTLQDIVEPRLIRYVNRKGQLVLAGYILNAIREFTRRYNATLNFLPILPADRALQTAFNQTLHRQVDIVCYIKEIIWQVPSSVTLYLLKDYIIVPHARPIASHLYFGRPFAWILWLAVIATVVYGMLMLYVSNGSDRSEIGLHLLWSLCHILFISQSRLTAFNWQQWTIHFIMILSGFILTNLYVAMLSSMLTSGLFEPQLNTLQDLKYSPYPLLVDDYYIDFLKQIVSLPSEVKNRMVMATSANLFKARTDLNTSYMYFAYEDRLEAALYQQNLLKVPRFKKIPESFMDGLMALPLAPSLPYQSLFNTYLRRIFECGVWHKLKSDSWMDTIDSGIYKLMRDDEVERKPFDLSFYLFVFILWAVGLTLAGLCLLMELLWWRM
ncbi:hypothetical protein KR093_007515, partial [Drosophila rubida]